jgi:hypothetical protein
MNTRAGLGPQRPHAAQTVLGFKVGSVLRKRFDNRNARTDSELVRTQHAHVRFVNNDAEVGEHVSL